MNLAFNVLPIDILLTGTRDKLLNLKELFTGRKLQKSVGSR